MVIIIIIIIIILLFIGILDYSIYNSHSVLVGYEVIKTPIKENKTIVLHPPKERKCKDMCKSSVCSSYKSQLEKYNLCKECNKEGKCYDPYVGRCIHCKERKSCEITFGCMDGPPIEPNHNFCKPCWNTISYGMDI